MRLFGMFLAVLIAITAITAPIGPVLAARKPQVTPTPVPPPPDPAAEALYQKARQAWDSTSYPRYATYTVGISYTKDGKPIERHYETAEDLRRNIVFARTFSKEEEATPADVPKGIDFGILGMTIDKAQEEDPIGPVALGINYDFGVARAPQQTRVAVSADDLAFATSPPIIGRTGVSRRDYDVKLIETLDNGATYHLGLTPLTDPDKHRLREMWIDAKTFVTKKLLVSANFKTDPLQKSAWLVTFEQIDGAPYIVSEEAQSPIDYGKAGELKDVKITFTDRVPLPILTVQWSIGINNSGASISEP